jgi:putative transposase
MPRQRRIALPGEIHHVMSRGLDQRPIFRDNLDRQRFLSITGKVLTEGNCLCYAWVLMENHYHLVLRPLNDPLQRIMRRVNGGYARYFNKRYGRKGYLFGDRYKSLATQEYWYLRELIRYVHLNPLRAGLVRTLEKLVEYPWSGHRGVLGLDGQAWHAVDQVRSRFGKTRREGREAYLAWLKAGLDRKNEGWVPQAAVSPSNAMASDMEPGSDDRVAGDAEFVRTAVARINREQRLKYELLRDRPPLSDLLTQLCRKHKLTKEFALTRGRCDMRSCVRSFFCKQSVREFGYSVIEVAAFLGINPSSVVRMVWKTNEKNLPFEI